MNTEIVREYLFNTKKIEYVSGKKPQVNCILCAVRDKNKEVESLEIFRDDHSIITVNLYPFSPGHLMIFPMRHVEDITELNTEEAASMHRLLVDSMKLIREEFQPSGFNIGWNIGHGSGASISHVHQHIVPRFNNEMGFLDIIGGARVFVVDPVEVMARLKQRFEKL